MKLSGKIDVSTTHLKIGNLCDDMLNPLAPEIPFKF